MLSASPAREGSAQATLLLSSDGLAPSLEPQPRLPVEATAAGLSAPSVHSDPVPGAELISASDLLAQTSLATGEESVHPVPGNESTSLIAGSVVVPEAALNGRMTDSDLAGEPFGGRAGEGLPQALQINTLATANGHPAAQPNTVSGLPPRAGQSGVTRADDAVHADGDLIRLAIAEATKAERGRGELSGVNPGAGKEAVDLPELSFESVRVTIRDPGAERAWSVRDPALQLPGLRQPLGHPEWSRALGERLAVVVRGEHQTARMSLNPAHLGPIDIQLRMQDDQAQLWLNAHHPQAREALDLAMPRLREMFAQQGIDLSHQQGQAGQSGEQQQDSGRSAGPAHSALSEETEAAPPPRERESGLLDDYA
ncbi:MAG: flagellar hook-length control protein FliK [Gammaproteobacteria bacterium]